MRLNLLFFIVLFLIFSFFITLNLFFERSFQQESLELSHRELSLLTQNLGEKLSYILNLVPKKYLSIKEYMEKSNFSPDHNFLKNVFVDEVSKLTGLNVEYKVGESLNNHGANIDIDVDLIGKKVKYNLYFQKDKSIKHMVIIISLDEIFKNHLRPVRISEKGYAWLMDKKGTLIYHPTQYNMIGNNIYDNNPVCFKCHRDFEVEKVILKGELTSGYQYFYSPDRSDKIIYYAKLMVYDKDWILCLSIPYTELMSAVNKSMKLHSFIVVSIFLSMVILGSLFYYINAKRIAAEEKLKFYSLLEGIIESTKAKIVVMDRNCNILLANSSYAKLLKIPKEEIVGINFFEICPQREEVYRKSLRNLINKALVGEAGEIFGYPLMENGSVRYYHITVTPLKIREEINGVVLTCDDITEEINLREQLERYANELEDLVQIRTKELSEEKEKLNIIMQSVNSGICLIDSNGNITWMNPKMEEFLALKKMSKSGHLNICELFSKIGDCLNSTEPTQFVQESVYNGQRKVFQVQITPFKTEDNQYRYVCLIQDITDLKVMEERIMQSEKLQALARISAGLAHEIGNPLTSISSYVQVLKEMDLGEFANQALDVISKHILRISEIIRNISSFAKPSKGEAVPTNVNEVLENSLNLVKFDKRMKNIEVQLKLAEVPLVMIDPNQLSQVFINLILNAADAMPEGGKLLIETKRVDDYVEISFTDTGVGIPPEIMPHIFDPFFTTKEKGTGLGLSVSYSIVKNFGGDINVVSEPGKGTTFTVKLPIMKEKAR